MLQVFESASAVFLSPPDVCQQQMGARSSPSHQLTSDFGGLLGRFQISGTPLCFRQERIGCHPFRIDGQGAFRNHKQIFVFLLLLVDGADMQVWKQLLWVLLHGLCKGLKSLILVTHLQIKQS